MMLEVNVLYLAPAPGPPKRTLQVARKIRSKTLGELSTIDSSGDDRADEDILAAGSGGGSPGGGGTGTGTSLPPAQPPDAPQQPVSVDELICTVGPGVLFDGMIPPDGLCHYIYYTSVAVVADVLHAVDTNEGWETFKHAFMGRKKTSGGIAFDIRYVTVMGLNAKVETALKDHASKNIKHYGVLNVLEASTKIKDPYAKAKSILAKLKRIQGSDRTRKTVLGMGIYNYNGHKSYETIKEIFSDAVNESVADTVIVYTSVGWLESRKDCLTQPPSVFDRSVYTGVAAGNSKQAPDILSISKMMRRDQRYKSGVKMGVSLELGTLVYKLKKDKSNVLLNNVNAPCVLQYVTNLDVVCKGLVKNSTFLRHGMSLLLSNAHLGDFHTDGPCKGLNERDREDPFWRIRVIRLELKIP
ncbi:hypothetical protein HPB50_019158 [Hyalomma asiaticum]|uniref:Uncharacterized protein n=1 Tax=Hyalomma asiaticum TaxID=266040 RepID=A0ACB7T5H4_HYAAI|nr:hypothetical protein HPB50_019158 [Hyalomma asiaticum]